MILTSVKGLAQMYIICRKYASSGSAKADCDETFLSLKF